MYASSDKILAWATGFNPIGRGFPAHAELLTETRDLKFI